MSLVSDLGVNYIREHICGCYFRRGNKVAYIRSCNNNDLRVSVLDLGNKEVMAWVPEDWPVDTLESFKDLAWPRLGYRNLESDAVFGNVVAYLSTERSVHRGFREELIQYQFPEVYNAMYFGQKNFHPACSNIYRISQIFDPQWIKFHEGMAKIKSLEFPGFAMNEDLAVALSIDQGPNRYCDLLFRNRVVGHIGEDGSLDLANVAMKRSSMKRLKLLMEQ